MTVLSSIWMGNVLIKCDICCYHRHKSQKISQICVNRYKNGRMKYHYKLLYWRSI